MAAHNPSRPAWTRRSTSRPSAPPPSPGALSSETQSPSLPPAVAPRKPFIPRHQLPRHSAPREPAPPAPSPLATPAPAPPPAPPAGHVLVTKDALEWMLSSFGLILASLLKLTPDWKALQAIAKATVQEYFPDLTPLCYHSTTRSTNLFSASALTFGQNNRSTSHPSPVSVSNGGESSQSLQRSRPHLCNGGFRKGETSSRPTDEQHDANKSSSQSLPPHTSTSEDSDSN